MEEIKDIETMEEIQSHTPETRRKTEKCEPFQKYIEVDSLARAYIPTQRMCDTFCVERGLKNGTIFPELYKPYNADAKWRRKNEPEHEW